MTKFKPETVERTIYPDPPGGIESSPVRNRGALLLSQSYSRKSKDNLCVFRLVTSANRFRVNQL